MGSDVTTRLHKNKPPPLRSLPGHLE